MSEYSMNDAVTMQTGGGSARRAGDPPGARNCLLGFRVALAPIH